MNLKQIFILSVLLCLSGCKPKVESSDLFSCPSREDFTNSSPTSYDMAIGEKVSNKINVNGSVTGGVKLSSVRVFMTTSNLTSLTVKIYRGQDNRDADEGDLIASATAPVLNQSLTPVGVDVNFSTPVYLKVRPENNDDYFIVFEPAGGSYSVNITRPSLMSSSRADVTVNGNWYHGGDGDENIAMIFSYSGCVK